MAGLYNDLVDFIPDKVITAFLFADDLDEHTVSSSPAKLSVGYSLPSVKVEAAFCHRDDLAPHNLTFDMDVDIICCALRVADSQIRMLTKIVMG